MTDPAEVVPAYKHPQFVVVPDDIIAERANGWVNFHPEDFCHRCGQRNVHAWHIDSAVWNSVVGGPVDSEWEGIVCPQCFTELHEQVHGRTSIWELRHVQYGAARAALSPKEDR